MRSSSSRQQWMPGVMTSRAVALRASKPSSANPLQTMSRSVTIPISRSFSPIGTAPISCLHINFASSTTGVSGPTHSTPLCIASLTFMADLRCWSLGRSSGPPRINIQRIGSGGTKGPGSVLHQNLREWVLRRGGPRGRGRVSLPPIEMAVADFDRFIEWPKPAYTRFRLGEGWGGGSGGCGDAVPPLSTPTPNPSPQGGGEEFAALLRRKLAPRCKLTPINVAAAAKAVLAGVLLVLNPIRRSCLHMLPPARSCVVRLWALFATRSPVCSVSATDSKCIQTALDYTDGGGICAAPGRRDKRREAHRAVFAGAEPATGGEHDHQAGIMCRNRAWLCD